MGCDCIMPDEENSESSQRAQDTRGVSPLVYELFVLGELMEQPMYGYLLHEIAGRILGPYSPLSWGIIYPLINKLEPEKFDAEMEDRIRRHREERDERFLTIEEPVDLASALRRIPPGTDLVIIDCLTVWLGNLLHRGGEPALTAAGWNGP